MFCSEEFGCVTHHYFVVEESLLLCQSSLAPSTQEPNQELGSFLATLSFGERTLIYSTYLRFLFELMSLVPAITRHGTLLLITLMAVFNYIFTWVHLLIICFRGVKGLCFIVHTVTVTDLPLGRHWVNPCWDFNNGWIIVNTYFLMIDGFLASNVIPLWFSASLLSRPLWRPRRQEPHLFVSVSSKPRTVTDPF